MSNRSLFLFFFSLLNAFITRKIIKVIRKEKKAKETMNLASHTERWMTLPSKDLIQEAKTRNPNYALSLRTVDAVTPCLQKVGEGYLSETGDIQVFLYVALDVKEKKVLASITVNDTTAFKVLSTVYDEEAKELLAAFCCDFPDALFSVEDGLPVMMFIHVTSAAPGILPGEKLKRYVTLNNLLECSHNKWNQLTIAVPAAKKTPTKENK
jgi:hypothetical protein